MPMFKRHALGVMGVCCLVTFALASGTALAQTPGTIAQFVTPSAFGDSPIFNSNGRIGIGTTTPQDFFAVNFSDNSGVFTGMAVKNTNSGPSAYSGMLFYDHNGQLGVFQGFNNSTKEYRINNVGAGGAIHFLQGQQSRFYVNNGGNVGIGTNSPTSKLTVKTATDQNFVVDVTGNKAGWLNDAGSSWVNSNWSGLTQTFKVGQFASIDAMFIDATGAVGIGTTTPTQGRLVVGSILGSFPLNQFGLLNIAGAEVRNGGGESFSASIYTYNAMAAPAFLAFSDARTKKIAGPSDGARDLATLSGIVVTDYSYIDTIGKGAGKQKKVVAQQVEQVFPQAVKRSTDTVPDIYKSADAKDGWVHLATDLIVGDRVRLIGKGTEGTYDVLEIGEGKFRTAFDAKTDGVFVYGREVKDFRMVDYEAIAMLNVSATQELHRRIQTQAAEMSKQASRIAALEQQSSEIAKLKQQMAQLLAAAQGTRPAPAHFAPGAR